MSCCFICYVAYSRFEHRDSIKHQTHSAVPSVSSSVSPLEETGLVMQSNIGTMSKQENGRVLKVLKGRTEDQFLQHG